MRETITRAGAVNPKNHLPDMPSFRTLLFVVATALLLLTSACKSSKQPKRYHPRTTHTDNHGKPDRPDRQTGSAWERLDIPLTRHDNRALYEELRTWLGTPYRYARAQKQRGTDCSGLVQQVYLTVFNIPLQRNSAKIYEKDCNPLKRAKLREADLVFFNNGKSRRITHVGIYLKEGYFVHASSSRGVVVSSLESKYWNTHFQCAGRVRNLAAIPDYPDSPPTLADIQIDTFMPY